jgi:hypothetical protein
VEADDLLEARHWIQELIALLPQLNVVALIGKHAALGWARLEPSNPGNPVPSPLATELEYAPGSRALIVDALAEAHRISTTRLALTITAPPSAGAPAGVVTAAIRKPQRAPAAHCQLVR